MRREVDLKEISDGKIYNLGDMVKAGCENCAGCFTCCTGMGNTIILDPLDLWRLTYGTKRTFEDLLGKELQLNLVDAIILPNIKMDEGNEERCPFLNEEGRCSIHAYRTGICRLFPLGRIYEDGDCAYILQTGECEKKNRTKVKIDKWLDIPNPRKYERFVIDWHYFLNDVEKVILESKSEEVQKKLDMMILTDFYMTPYRKCEEDYNAFYDIFYARLETAKKHLKYMKDMI